MIVLCVKVSSRELWLRLLWRVLSCLAQFLQARGDCLPAILLCIAPIQSLLCGEHCRADMGGQIEQLKTGSKEGTISLAEHCVLDERSD